MRTPRENALPRSERLRILALDVTRPDSIAAAVEASGPIDVLVNNAGIASSAPSRPRRCHGARVFETNTFGVMALIQALLPGFRARRAGVIVNVTSSATLAPMPLAAAYTASKIAIEGFTGSLAFELAAFDIRVKLVRAGLLPDPRASPRTAARAWKGSFLRRTSLSPSRSSPRSPGRPR